MVATAGTVVTSSASCFTTTELSTGVRIGTLTITSLVSCTQSMTVTFTVLVWETGLYVMVWQCVHGSMCVSGTMVVDVTTRSSSRGLSEVTQTVRFSSLKSIFRSMVGTVVDQVVEDEVPHHGRSRHG